MEYIYNHRTIPEKCNDNFTNNAKKLHKNMGEPNYKFQDYFTGFPIFRGAWQAPPSSYNFFLKLPSIKTDYPHEGAPPLKNEASHLKNNNLPLSAIET